MRLIVRVTILSIILFILIITLWNISLNSLTRQKQIISEYSSYENNLLDKINKEVKAHSNFSFDFVAHITKQLESSPRLCDIKYLHSIPKCKEIEGRKLISSMTYDQLVTYAENTYVKFGGYWVQNACNSDQTIAVIIPFRDRWLQIMQLLPILHQLLQIQNNCYRIFIIEQLGSETFNKGRLNNAGFLQSLTMFHFDCVIFHDTDLIPETSKIPYKCGDNQPVHLASAVDVNNYRLPYSTILGGVLAFKPYHYVHVNGYSNYYWGWGLEDDDMELRLRNTIGYSRVSESIGRYRTVKHNPQYRHPIQELRRKVLLNTATKRMRADGLNSVKYNIIRISNKLLYTHIIVDIGNQPNEFFS